MILCHYYMKLHAPVQGAARERDLRAVRERVRAVEQARRGALRVAQVLPRLARRGDARDEVQPQLPGEGRLDVRLETHGERV